MLTEWQTVLTQIKLLRSSLIWVSTVCSDMSIQIFRVNVQEVIVPLNKLEVSFISSHEMSRLKCQAVLLRKIKNKIQSIFIISNAKGPKCFV